jgi:hypothetical protein
MRAPSGRSAKKELAEGGPPADLLTTIQAARLKIKVVPKGKHGDKPAE